MNPMTFDEFLKLWTVLLDNFGKAKSDETIAFTYQTLMAQDPELSAAQLLYCVQKCLLSCTFMPSVAELLRQIYEQDDTDAPGLPGIDPRWANEYQLSQYHTAMNTREKWMASHNHPDIGRFRGDRLKEIPGIPALLAQHNEPLLRSQIPELLEKKQKNLLLWARDWKGCIDEEERWNRHFSEIDRQYLASLPPEMLLPPTPEPEPEPVVEVLPEPVPVPKPVVKAPKPIKKMKPVIVEPDPVPELSPQEKEQQLQERKRKALEDLAKWEKERGPQA